MIIPMRIAEHWTGNHLNRRVLVAHTSLSRSEGDPVVEVGAEFVQMQKEETRRNGLHSR